ncbi:Vacuolar segregation protein 7 [Cyberlindnera fabianii]|uniref:Vacuolar segregation protein 7 n=1 Tax=Cyberlindnera fabianii TaxID=36022 RepID=A0A1V2L6R1_CYBFA|nr:Vacuolar segregation protein 7 [Cyberlindnera fabianii]
MSDHSSTVPRAEEISQHDTASITSDASRSHSTNSLRDVQEDQQDQDKLEEREGEKKKNTKEEKEEKEEDDHDMTLKGDNEDTETPRETTSATPLIARKSAPAELPILSNSSATTTVDSSTSNPPHTAPNSTRTPATTAESSLTTTPVSTLSAGNSKHASGLPKKKDLMRPLFSRSSTTDKITSKPGNTKSMIVETETVDASNTPSVTLPIASSTNVISNDLLSNPSTLANNLSALRNKKSTLFVETNGQVNTQPTSSTAFDNDNASIAGSIRTSNKRLAPADSHLNITKPGATKADLFAARIANAVGDGSDSDSEETFVYESAPDALTTNTLPTNKTIAALGPNNPLALRKLSQRNISMPVTSSSHPFSPSTTSHVLSHNDDGRDHGLNLYETDEESDHGSTHDQKTLTRSTAADTQQQFHQLQHQHLQQQQHQLQQDQENLRQSPTQNHFPTPQKQQQQQQQQQPQQQQMASKSALFTKYNGGSRKPSNTSLMAAQKNGNMSQLRTTTSKLFDVKGGTLRRYSGVPDDVNIEDYLDQYDEENQIGDSDYADSYHYEDEDDDDELTPLNVNNANHKLRSKMSKHYQHKRSVSNFGSTDRTDLADFGFDKDETTVRRPRSLKAKRPYARGQQYQQEQEQYSPHNFYNRKRNTKIQMLKNAMCLSVTVFVLLAVGFIGGFLLANSKELQDLEIVSVDDIIVSVDELVFDLSVGAYNHGLLGVDISQVELDLFAKTTHLAPSPLFPSLDDAKGDVQTILLGSVTKFETPLHFESGFIHRNYTVTKGEIKLLHPGQNTTDHDQENHKSENDLDKWRKIIEHPFDLIVRGTFMYEVPLLKTEQSVAVTKTVTVDPTEDEKEKA